MASTSVTTVTGVAMAVVVMGGTDRSTFDVVVGFVVTKVVDVVGMVVRLFSTLSIF